MTQSNFFWTNGNFAIALHALHDGTVIADETAIINQVKTRQNFKNRYIKIN